MSKYYISLLGFFMSVHLLMAQNGFIERITSETGSFKDDMVIDFKDGLGHEGYLPISILKGETDGPVFTVVAGVHGYEYPPIVATQSIVKSIDLKTLKGTLIVIPIANTASFFSRTPFVNPQDNKNLNNAFPGKENGTITEQIAHFITTNIIPISDVFLDIHGGDACEDLIPFVCYYNNEKQPEQTALAKTLSDKSGFEYVVSYPYTILDTEPAKYAFKQAVQDGKTALSIECGKLGNVQDENVNLIKKGVFNMLAAMNMYAVEIEPHQDVIYLNEQYYVKATKQGVFYSTYKAGDKVKKDAVVGYTTDVFGKVIEEYTAPNDGLILYKLATPPINVGDTVMCISSLN
ncbi:succinylglutamate desuccinylase/aspartoacylase family protein [Mesoflavibacter zeaxanthinifaciens]|uniref:succinylglutamate desuccinylase/aspartoacylase family protein n=1 Tax=Mesoflavibacter zeaxanthinifaciens TaxID=393060 RepID=UPI003A8CCB44